MLPVSFQVCESYQHNDDTVMPASVLTNVFTTAAIDNIDHNPTSATSTDSFHGTSITIIQHPDTEVTVPKGIDLSGVPWSRRVTSRLPNSYTSLPPTGNPTSDLAVSCVNSSLSTYPTPDYLPLLNDWLETVDKHVIIDNIDHNEHVGFAAYHSLSVPDVVYKCHSTLLPLLRDEVHSPGMVRHLMDLIMDITSKVNNGQAAVITADQPVYAIAKNLQWKFPKVYGEDHLVIMLGGLHIEMAIATMIGKWLTGSGWTEMLMRAEFATSGRCDMLLRGSNVKRSRYAHEVTLAVLHILKKRGIQVTAREKMRILSHGQSVASRSQVSTTFGIQQ